MNESDFFSRNGVPFCTLLTAGPGLHFVLCPLKSIVGRLSLRIQQLDVHCETKTKGASSASVLLCCALRGLVLIVCMEPTFGSTFWVLFFLLALLVDNVFVQVRFLIPL